MMHSVTTSLGWSIALWQTKPSNHMLFGATTNACCLMLHKHHYSLHKATHVSSRL